VFDALNRQRFYIDVFRRGRSTFDVTVTPSAPWIVSSVTSAVVDKDLRIWVSVDWGKAPPGVSRATVDVAAPTLRASIDVEARNPAGVTRDTLKGFAEGAGYVSIEPAHVRSVGALSVTHGDMFRAWTQIEDYGRTLSGMRADASLDASPATAGVTSAGQDMSPRLEYGMYLFTPGKATTTAILSPTLNVVPGRGLRMAISMDDEAPQIVTIVPAGANAAGRDWEESVKNNARVVTTTHDIAAAGYHTLKIWMIDPTVVVQKLIVTTGGAMLPQSYLGPPESFHVDEPEVLQRGAAEQRLRNRPAPAR
jgi:hypothetical protein